MMTKTTKSLHVGDRFLGLLLRFHIRIRGKSWQLIAGGNACLPTLHRCVLILASLPEGFVKFYSRSEDTDAEIQHRPFRAWRLSEGGKKSQGREQSFLNVSICANHSYSRVLPQSNSLANLFLIQEFLEVCMLCGINKVSRTDLIR